MTDGVAFARPAPASVADCNIETIVTKHIVDNPRAWLTVFGTTIGVTLAFVLIAANFYHRILLYIAFGKRRMDLRVAA